MSITSRTGRRALRRPAALVAVAVALGVSFYGASRGRDGVARGPAFEANRSPAAPVVDQSPGFPVILAPDAPQRIVPDVMFPDGPSSLLWFQGRQTNPAPDGRIAIDGAGGVLEFRDDLRPHHVRLEIDSREVASVAAATGGGFWLVASNGDFIRTDADGAVRLVTASPFDYTSVTSDAAGNTWAVRSPIMFSMRWEPASAPALVRVGEDGAASDSLSSVVVPRDFLLSQLASSGHVAVGPDAIYYGPFVRDQVIAMNFHGDTLWIAKRGLPQEAGEPRFLVEDGVPAVDYAPVNRGITFGPDGLLYALSVPGFSVAESRLDAYDPESGRLVRSALLDTAVPTLSVDSAGRVYLVDEFRLMTGVPPVERTPVAAFDLELLDGGRIATRDLESRVTLINFWASWCEPCRVEMPALDSLQAGIAHPEFRFLTFNEDVDPRSAREFIDEYGFDFPVALGLARLKDRFHYMGLPFTVLVDRSGRVVQRWIGFAGEEQIQAIRSVVIAELERGLGPVDGTPEGHRMSDHGM